jgi:two-component system sensor histidine kinase HydH
MVRAHLTIRGTYDLRKQQTAFCVLTLFALAMLLLLHILFAFQLGEPSLRVVANLGLSFGLRLAELGWLQSQRGPLSERVAKLDGATSILTLFLLAGLLAWLTNRDHSPYQVLLAIPVLQSACLFGLPATVLTILAADGTIFLWLRHYFSLHPQPSGGEYLEAGMLAIVLAIVGILMWILARLLRAHQAALSDTLVDLQNARESLVREEKLAAVGRLASGIAHEIRNPVAMIASALTTAADAATEVKEREEMFAIAGRQARRLEILTTDFLTYARPSVPRRSPILLADLLSSVEGITRIRAIDRHIEVTCRTAQEATVNIDASQVEGALMNLTLNAVEATAEKSAITVAAGVEDNVLHIEVENSGSAIPDSNLARIFEPFFTTKQGGTGLGLAIARGVARAHGGDLWVSRNENGRVAFTMTLAANVADGNQQEAVRG